MTQNYSSFDQSQHRTEVRYANFLSGGFTMTVINPPERKLAKRISVQCGGWSFLYE